MSYWYFDENAFLQKLQNGINQVKQVLGAERNPKIAPDCPHRWTDKFALADFTLSTTASSILETLKKLGLSDAFIKKNAEKNFKTKTVTLAFERSLECVFVKKEERVEKSDAFVVEKTNTFGMKKQEKSFVETAIVEWKWKVTVSWKLEIYLGNNDKECEILKEHTGSYEMKTLVDQAPFPTKQDFSPISLQLSSLFTRINPAGSVSGCQINRADDHCLTPCRNPQAEEAIELAKNLVNWCENVVQFLSGYCFSAQTYSSTISDVSSVFNLDSVTLACLPLLQDDKDRPTLADDSNKLLDASFKSVDAKIESLHKKFAKDSSLLSQKEAELGFLVTFLSLVSSNLKDSLSYLERLIELQIREALGRHIDPTDFDDYMRFHNRTFFNPLYTPKPFCYPIRRPDHVPEGTLSLELKDKPIQTIVSTATDSAAPMFFTLDESTRVVFKGEKHVHGFLRTAFEDSQSLELQLTARARQFSSFILLVGKIVEKDQFEPEDAIVLQNKDHVLVRLLTEVIPSAKQFKEAISSLSPEQQRFAQAFRSMQLSSTLFAVCIVQIKPALEKVLNLPSDSLTKEIQLTQDLMKLFIDYQIPSDLLSYDAALQAGPQSVADKVAIVKKNTDEMLKIIEKEKQTQLQGLVENVIGDALLSRDEGFSYEEESIPQTRKTKKSAKVMTAMAFGAPPSATYSSASPSYSPQMPMASAFFSAAPVPQKQMAAIPPPTPQAVPGGSGVRADRASPPDYTHKPELESHAPKDIDPEDEEEGGVRNYAKIPLQLDELFEKLDKEGSVRPTILSTGLWTLKSYPSLISSQKTHYPGKKEQKQQKQKAFDLIDALTKSGAIEMDNCDLHIIIALTHNFTKALMAVLVQENVNPIEKVQSSSIILASCIHKTGEKFANIVSAANLEKVKEFCPQLKL